MKHGLPILINLYEKRRCFNDFQFFSQLGLAPGAIAACAGKLLTGEVKAILVEELEKLVGDHQERLKSITDETVRHFMDPTRESLRNF